MRMLLRLALCVFAIVAFLYFPRLADSVVIAVVAIGGLLALVYLTRPYPEP